MFLFLCVSVFVRMCDGDVRASDCVHIKKVEYESGVNATAAAAAFLLLLLPHTFSVVVFLSQCIVFPRTLYLIPHLVHYFLSISLLFFLVNEIQSHSL